MMKGGRDYFSPTTPHYLFFPLSIILPLLQTDFCGSLNFSFSSRSLLHGCLPTFSGVCCASPTLQCFLVMYATVHVVLVEEWEGWRGRWRKESLGWKRRRRRGPLVRRGCHSNRLSQPVAAILITIHRIW